MPFTSDLLDGSLKDNLRDDLQKRGFHPIPPDQILKSVPEVLHRELPEPQKPNTFVLTKPLALVSFCLEIAAKGHTTIKKLISVNQSKRFRVNNAIIPVYYAIIM